MSEFENYESMLKDAYKVIYENRNYGSSYNSLWNYLSKKYTLKREKLDGNEIDFSYNVAVIFNRFFDKLFKIEDSTNSFEFTQNLDIVYYIKKIPDLRVDYYQGKEDIYIISLKIFQKNWFLGISFIEYLHYIKNEVGITSIEDEYLFRIYTEITGVDSSFKSTMNYSIISNFATTESIFRLLEYKELQHSLKESEGAKKAANISLWVAIGTFVISCGLTIYFSNKQIEQSERQFNIEHPTIKGVQPKPIKPVIIKQK